MSLCSQGGLLPLFYGMENFLKINLAVLLCLAARKDTVGEHMEAATRRKMLPYLCDTVTENNHIFWYTKEKENDQNLRSDL